MPSVEGMYVVEFGDAALPGQPTRNHGVVVLETNRIYGGDSGYYFVGTFTIKDGTFDANANIVKHNPAWRDAFGDTSTSFDIRIQGTVSSGTLQGTMTRLDMSSFRLPIKLTWKVALP